jgi:cytochrome c oxidase subunit 2
MDAVPGRYSKLWFKPTIPGEYDLVCAEYCGTDHSSMVAKVVVHEPGGFEKWLRDASNLLSPLLRQEDLRDPLAVFKRLKESDHPSVEFIRAALPEEIRNAVAGWDGATTPDTAARESLVSALNVIIKGEGIHTPERFKGVVIDEKTEELLAGNPEGEDLQELNRRLLSNVFGADVVTPGPKMSEVGAILYEKKGACAQCHTLDGTRDTGPSFKGLWGKREKMQDGTVVLVDENYLRESILEPNAKVVAGYDNVMNTYKGKLSDREIDALIAFIKSLSE